MYIDFFLEEYSAKAMLEVLLPKILPLTVNWEIRDFRGKQQLLQKIPLLLKSYASWLPSNHHIVILIDRDQEDCHQLKAQLEAIAAGAGLTSKSTITSGSFQVLNRIAIEELEAWFLGDIEAICTAYPGVPISLAQQARFRDPDNIKGGTAEALEQILQNARHHLGGLEKARAAREIAAHMEPSRNRSASFQAFLTGLQELVNTPNVDAKHTTRASRRVC
jgi:2'-5' RNA ligase